PPQLGPPAQDSQAGARRIDEDTIAAAVAEREVPAVRDDREHVIEPEAVPGGGDPPNPSRLYVAGDDAPLRNPLADSRCLSARRGGDVHHGVARLRGETPGGGLAGRGLWGPPPGGDRRHRGRIADPPDEQRAVGERAGRHLGLGRAQLAGYLVPVGPPSVDPYRHGRGLVPDRQRR